MTTLPLPPTESARLRDLNRLHDLARVRAAQLRSEAMSDALDVLGRGLAALARRAAARPAAGPASRSWRLEG